MTGGAGDDALVVQAAGLDEGDGGELGDDVYRALSGPAGIGKSRLAQECVAVARGRGFLPLLGAAGVLQQDLSYAPLVEALRPLVRQAAGPGRPALMEGLLDLGQLFGDLSLPPGPALGDPGLERTRLFESVCRLLERASARQPLALLLDDVQWADRGSLALLHYLIRGLGNRPVLVLLTHRQDEANPALHDLLGGEAPAALLDVLAARSGGVPLFVGALVGSLVDTGALYRFDGRWTLAPHHPEAVPAVVSALLQSHVERLPDDARLALDLLAVCRAQVDHALLERLGRCHLALIAGCYVEGRVHLSELLILVAQLGDALEVLVRRPGCVFAVSR